MKLFYEIATIHYFEVEVMLNKWCITWQEIFFWILHFYILYFSLLYVLDRIINFGDQAENGSWFEHVLQWYKECQVGHGVSHIVILSLFFLCICNQFTVDHHTIILFIYSTAELFLLLIIYFISALIHSMTLGAFW